MRPKIDFRDGDVVAIPLPSGRSAIARVIHISARYKDAIGVAVYQLLSRGIEDVVAAPGELDLSRPVIAPLYTNVKAADHHGWRVLRREVLSDADWMLTKRIVGGGIEIGDEYVGPATADDYERLPQMLAYGMPGIHRRIEEVFGSKDVTLKPKHSP